MFQMLSIKLQSVTHAIIMQGNIKQTLEHKPLEEELLNA